MDPADQWEISPELPNTDLTREFQGKTYRTTTGQTPIPGQYKEVKKEINTPESTYQGRVYAVNTKRKLKCEDEPKPQTHQHAIIMTTTSGGAEKIGSSISTVILNLWQRNPQGKAADKGSASTS